MEVGNIPNFSNYLFNITDKSIFNLKTNKQIKITSSTKGGVYAKLKDDSNNWRSISIKTIEALVSGVVTQPDGFIEVPGFKGVYINKSGNVWTAPTKQNPSGHYATIHLPSDGKHYPSFTTLQYGTVNLHQLIALTFIDKDYIAKGLCVMHLDDNKLNYNLSNLKVSTYSDNNKAAYLTGVNPGNGLAK